MDLTNVLAKAQRMMISEDFNNQVERAAAAQSGRKMKGGGSADIAGFEDALFGISNGPSIEGYEKNPLPENVKYQQSVDYSGVQMIQPRQQEINTENSKLPKAILESFKKNPSPLNDMDSSAVAMLIESGQMQMKPQVRETVQRPAPQPVPQNAGSGIDYNALKFIINECIQNALKEKLNEGVVRGMKIGDGNVIQFLDSRGNLYEGQLKLKKKAKK